MLIWSAFDKFVTILIGIKKKGDNNNSITYRFDKLDVFVYCTWDQCNKFL